MLCTSVSYSGCPRFRSQPKTSCPNHCFLFFFFIYFRQMQRRILKLSYNCFFSTFFPVHFSFIHHCLYSPVWTLASIFGFVMNFWHMVGLLGWVISTLQGLYLHNVGTPRTNIRALSGIWTPSPVYECSRPMPQTVWPLDQLINHPVIWCCIIWATDSFIK
jgi:hypothetical protein